ncbi:MAG: hypothetical protein Q4G19_04290 [Clostridia bacterium]|nr:hypothetical protein [Clostridia bacterium]
MKKITALLMVLVLIIGCAGTALAAKPSISQQPEDVTVEAGKSCVLTVKAKNYKSLTWVFINPKTGKEITGRKIAKSIKGLKVTGPNKSSLTLGNVPESMNGWSYYCKLVGDGYTVKSDTATIFIKGMEAPTPTPEPVTPTITEWSPSPVVPVGGSCTLTVKAENAKEYKWIFVSPKTKKEINAKTVAKTLKGLEVTGATRSKLTLTNIPKEMNGWYVYCKVTNGSFSEKTDPVVVMIEGMDLPAGVRTPDPTPTPMPTPTPKPKKTKADKTTPTPVPDGTVTITAEGALLQAAGSADAPAAALTLTAPAAFTVTAEGNVDYWVINGITISADTVAGTFTLEGVTEDMTITAGVK